MSRTTSSISHKSDLFCSLKVILTTNMKLLLSVLLVVYLSSFYEGVQAKPQGCAGIRWRPCANNLIEKLNQKRNMMKYDKISDEVPHDFLEEELTEHEDEEEEDERSIFENLIAGIINRLSRK
ncbi:uncharacterized protein LOC130629575 [Hydractinia symbiolongicarpus]|uniref:uncharacterized protein LOC130629575 n=1 Tax=Hydractinia symbiolongicarpus TaxID=13093 RepID=UPI00254BE5E9|nr:uncharacterized protein LOC130629575 [Hydractinia symbiolongicarpus]